MKRYILGILCGAFCSIYTPTQAQFFKKLKKAVQQRVENKVIREAGDAAENTVDKAKTIGTKRSESMPNGNGDDVSMTGTQGENPQSFNTGSDFIAGERTLFQTSFSETPVSNFPQNLIFRGGEISVASTGNAKVLRTNSKGAFAIKLPEKLPEKFTLEFQEFNSEYVNDMRVSMVDDKFKPIGNHYVKVDGYHGSGIASYKNDGVSSMNDTKEINERMTPIRVMADGTYVKVYVGSKRVGNIPNANLGRSNILLFEFLDVRSKPIYIADIRVAAGGRDLYQTLEAEGRIAFNDIHFATGKADILPESSETIQQIAQLLKDHSDLNILIEGHTDNTGNFDKNMELSRKRADAVKIYLISKYGIDGTRLRSVGQGQTQPVGTNDTEEGRAKNRRVEIVKI